MNKCFYLGRKTGVWIVQAAGDTVLAGNRFDLLNQTDDRLVFLIRLAERGFELFVSIQQALDFFHRVDDEHVDQILTCSIQPVVERLSMNLFSNKKKYKLLGRSLKHE